MLKSNLPLTMQIEMKIEMEIEMKMQMEMQIEMEMQVQWRGSGGAGLVARRRDGRREGTLTPWACGETRF
jgi:hypothetical protein